MAFFFTVSVAMRAQVAPAATGPGTATGFGGVQLDGVLHYDLRYAQTVQISGGQDGQLMSIVSGDAGYTTLGKRRLFTMQYGGGYSWSLDDGSGSGNLYQRLTLSQEVSGRRWKLMGSDNVSYFYETPTTGFSGVPGSGEPIGGGGSGSSPNQTILATTRNVDNTSSALYSQQLDHATSLGGVFTYGILRFPDSNGQDSNQVLVGLQISRRLDARNSIQAQYSYAHYSFPGSVTTMDTHTVMFGYLRTWNRYFKTTVFLGPEWTKMSNVYTLSSTSPPTEILTQFPTMTGLALNASASYIKRSTTAIVSYTQADTGSSGALGQGQIGIGSRNVMLGLTQQFGKKFSLQATGAYMRSQSLQQGLQQSAVTTSEYGEAQATRKLGRYFSVFANYTVEQQSSGIPLPANAVSGVYQVIGFGLGYTPRDIRLKK
jgi:hypothetical protein